ncbi:MAG: hypothetical protein L6R35_004295 [Caloplaca aegaea]|nr:MAG: hypothetical protein L6R35_004295 [Caloplaca aegaea]
MAVPRAVTVRQPRCHTCCQCRSKIALICARVQCPACTHTFCCECVVDTIEVYHNPYIGTHCSPPPSHAKIAKRKADAHDSAKWPSHDHTSDGTKQGYGDYTALRAAAPARGRMAGFGAWRRCAPFDGFDTAMKNQRKRKVRSPPVDRPPASLGYDEDGRLFLFRRASETLTLTELSILDERGGPRIKRSQAARQRPAARQGPAAKAQRLRKAPRNNLPSKRRAAG